MKYFRNSEIKFLIDILSYSSFVFLCTTGLLMSFILPPGSGNRYQVWGLDRHQWGDIHFWVSMFFLATIVLHLIMHWKWIWIMIRGKGKPGFSLRAKLGIAGIIVALILFASPLISPILQNDSRGYGALRNDPPRRNQNIQSGRNESRGYAALRNDPPQRNQNIQSERNESRGYGALRNNPPRRNQNIQSGRNEFRGYGALRNDPPRRNQNIRPGRYESRGYGAFRNQPVRRNRAQSFDQKPEEIKEDCQDHAEHDSQDYVIMGNMNLQEISNNTGVPVDYLVKELDLPVNVSVLDHLGQLRRSYGFHMQDVRDAVTDYL